MAFQFELDKTYLRMAFALRNLSTAKRLKVGSLIVKNNHIISEGLNGTLPNESNTCEFSKIDPTSGEVCLITKPDVIHAELNAIDKVARSHDSTVGATMYVTHSPCYPCAIRIVNVNIVRVVYCHEYRNLDGINFLSDRISVSKITQEQLLENYSETFDI